MWWYGTTKNGDDMAPKIAAKQRDTHAQFGAMTRVAKYNIWTKEKNRA